MPGTRDLEHPAYEPDRVVSSLRGDVGSAVPELLAGYRALTTLVRPATLGAPVITRDPDDDQVLACALGAAAELIVTRDRHLLDLVTFQRIRILPAHEALALIPTSHPEQPPRT